MFGFIYGSAVITSAIIGLSALCSSLSSKNNKLSNEITYRTRENYALMKKHQKELEKAKSISEQETKLKAIKACISTTQKSSDIAYKNYIAMKNILNTHYKQLEEIKKNKNNLKQTLDSSEIDQTQKTEITLKLRDFNKIISKIYKNINNNKTKLEDLYSNLKELNNQVNNYKKTKKEIIHNLQQPYQKRQCKECGVIFTITNNEFNYYKNKNFHLPCRCYNCRQQRKAA